MGVRAKDKTATEVDFSEKRQRKLAAGVLKQATRDSRRSRGATSRAGRELYLDAYRWLTANEFSWPLSFLNVCDALRLAPETVRARGDKRHLVRHISLLDAPNNLRHRAMKSLTKIMPLYYHAERLPVPPTRNLVGEWQCGPETLSGCAQRKLRLSFAPLPAQSAPAANH
jgi:hypothetical protein